MLVQSFRAFHHSPGHNSVEHGSILINLVSLESWSIGIQFGYLLFLHLHSVYLHKMAKTTQKRSFLSLARHNGKTLEKSIQIIAYARD